MRNIIGSAWNAYRENGLRHLARSAYRSLVHWSKVDLPYAYYRTFKSRTTFLFQGRKFPYFYHKYNMTWTNERAVEISIAKSLLEEHRGEEILEVGNVLSHYTHVSHDIVDKYEKAEGVILEDVVDFKPTRSYDLILTVSTLEHVGWDEDPTGHEPVLGQPSKILDAFSVLESCLAQGGLMAVTLPLGQNPELDRLLNEGRVPFTERHCMKRISKGRWVEASWDDCKGTKYGEPYPAANAIVILFIKKGGGPIE